ncbi:HPP family protein [Azospirillum sp. Sh1]|uniref:HPP family protein n=1 Tax=Azospirillum sp. Sh1 TaxID=2607285 RepID=UPI0011EE6430|nr:HPP family protein [Azospirillum sp. Sh1]KAA0571344.1 HPP family protein [Azospirillum sp. Sh1]
MTRGKLAALRHRLAGLGELVFRPILPGATLRDRMIACCGALLGIAATGLLCRNMLTFMSSAPVLVAPMGASAVLLFAVPASPLAQPWSIIGGNTLSAIVGVLVASVIPDPMLAGAAAVALAIATMSLTRCLHPPGGAAALTAVLGGPAVTEMGIKFAFFPVAVNSILLLTAGLMFHRLSGHRYPHKAVNTHRTNDPPAQLRPGLTQGDVDVALRTLAETLDVSRDDLGALLVNAELHALERLHADITCREIMSRDVVTVTPDTHPQVARARLLEHGFRTLPVVDGQNMVVGIVGHEQLSHGDAVHHGSRVAAVMAPAATELPDTPVFRLLGRLSDGRTHDVVIVDQNRRVLGMITQTDLLVVLARTALARAVQTGVDGLNDALPRGYLRDVAAGRA